MLFCIFYIAFLLVVNAMHNVTVDDNEPSIIYHPPDSWVVSVFDVLDAGGRHHVTSDSDATASLTFTGVAIYFYSPLWTFQVTTLVTLDSSPSVLLDLRDYTQPLDINGPESVQSSIVWSRTGLANTKHTLLVSVGPGQTLAVLDTLMYTVLDANDIQSSSSSTSSSSSSSFSSSTPSSNPSTASENSSNKGLAVTLGVVCSVFGLLVLSGVWWFIRRVKRRGDDNDFYDSDYPRTINNDHHHSPQMSDTTINTPATYNYSLSRTASSSSRGRDSRFRPIPTPTPIATVTNARRNGSNTTNNTSSSTTRHHHHSSSSASSSKFKNLKNPLTPIPEALREPSLARHTSKSPVRESSRRQRYSLSSSSSSPSLLAANDEREEA